MTDSSDIAALRVQIEKLDRKVSMLLDYFEILDVSEPIENAHRNLNLSEKHPHPVDVPRHSAEAQPASEDVLDTLSQCLYTLVKERRNLSSSDELSERCLRILGSDVKHLRPLPDFLERFWEKQDPTLVRSSLEEKRKFLKSLEALIWGYTGQEDASLLHDIVTLVQDIQKEYESEQIASLM